MWRNLFSVGKGLAWSRIAMWGPTGWCWLLAEVASAGLDVWTQEAPWPGQEVPKQQPPALGSAGWSRTISLPVSFRSYQPLGSSGGLWPCSSSHEMLSKASHLSSVAHATVDWQWWGPANLVGWHQKSESTEGKGKFHFCWIQGLINMARDV